MFTWQIHSYEPNCWDPCAMSMNPGPVTDSAGGRTPEVKGPKPASSSQVRLKTPKDERPKPTLGRGEAGEGKQRGQGEREGEGALAIEEAGVETHTISTPPDAATCQPLFTPAQLQDLRNVYDQAPWLYSRFQTPQTSMPPRPTFLRDEEGRHESVRGSEKELRRFEEWKRLKELKEYENEEREEMSRQIQELLQENRRLKDQATGIYPVLKARDHAEASIRRRMADILDENRTLKQDLQRITTALHERKEEEQVFATPNGSAELSSSVPPSWNQPCEQRPEARPEDLHEEEEEATCGFDRPAARSGKGKGTRKKKEEPVPEDPQQQTMAIILKLMEGMQSLQKQMIKGHREEDSKEAEVVRTSVEVPKLAEWNQESAPIDYADWLLLLQPIMADLSESSEAWWEETLRTAKEWYSQHMAKTPLDRLSHAPKPSSTMAQKRWSRLEKRASALLLSAIPETLREEVVAAKNITTLGILAKGMVQYQPGGLAERQAILSALEAPQEASTVGAAIGTLRRWLRWKRRAEEMGVSVPDPTILARGLTRLVRKLLGAHPELQFKLQLARSALSVDSIPTYDGIAKYAEHLMAELEQVNHQARKKEPQPPEPPKLKRFEEQRDQKEGKERKEESEKEKEREKPKCKFYLSDQGCKRGKSCGFSHDQRDERRRCWNCGGTDHMSPACTRPKEIKESAPKAKTARKEKEKGEGERSEDAGKGTPSLNDLLKEANDMLKSMHSQQSPSSSTTSSPTSTAPPDQERKEVMERLQQQLNMMKQKTFRLRRLQKGQRDGLLQLTRSGL
ncbi:unnamed protein product [Durusdinium trenchii]|uniref:C3H1-type domain-containing protein n=1 Tax=Durusdinium trenchii TaxID=1381693 RepID=A0ABP0SME9_9DINO